MCLYGRGDTSAHTVIDQRLSIHDTTFRDNGGASSTVFFCYFFLSDLYFFFYRTYQF
jgi:hypothetical protein